MIQPLKALGAVTFGTTAIALTPNLDLPTITQTLVQVIIGILTLIGIFKKPKKENGNI